MSTKLQLKRKTINLDMKIQILDRLATGEGSTAVGKHFGLKESTIRSIKKNEASIRKSVISGTKLSTKSSYYTRDIVREKMEKALVIWIEDSSQKNTPVDRSIIKHTALRIYKHIKEMEPNRSDQKVKRSEFSASTSWMAGFLQRYSLHNIKDKGDIADRTKLTAYEFPQELTKIIEELCSTPDDWNVNGTEIYDSRNNNKPRILNVLHCNDNWHKKTDSIWNLEYQNFIATCSTTINKKILPIPISKQEMDSK